MYRDLAGRRTGEERDILLALAAAEARHEQHWLTMLGDHVGKPRRGDVRARILGFLARHFGSVFVLALAQRAEARSTYDADVDATATMAADERIHGEVVRALAARGRSRLSGSFRAAVFGANDGLVSNLALVLGISASGVSNHTVLVTGAAGLLAGALSMGAGEFVSVRSQRELLRRRLRIPTPALPSPALDVDANELALVYRARGMSEAEAVEHANEISRRYQSATRGQMGFNAPIPPSTRRSVPACAPVFRVSAFSHREHSYRCSPTCSGFKGPSRSSLRRCSSASRSRHRRDRGAAVWRAAPSARAAPTPHRIRRRRSHILAGPNAGYRVPVRTGYRRAGNRAFRDFRPTPIRIDGGAPTGHDGGAGASKVLVEMRASPAFRQMTRAST